MAVVIDGTLATFMPPAGATGLVGDFTDWYKHSPLSVTPGTPLTLRLPRGAWVEYAWLDETGAAFADPDNPQKSLNPWWGYPRAAVVGEYPFHPLWQGHFWGEGEAQARPRGESHRLAWEGKVFAGKRRGYIYTPPDYHTRTGPLEVYYIQDGVAFYRTGKLCELLERAMSLGLVRGAVLVFVEPIERNTEYYLNDDYYTFLRQEVMPQVEGRFDVRTDPQGRGLWGASLGGLISLYTAWQHPETFGRVVSHSGCFIAEPDGRHGSEINTTTAREWLTQALPSRPPTGMQVSLDTGTLEWLTAPNRRMSATLQDLGIAHQYREYPSGHNWVSWKNALAEALLYMQGG